MLRIFLIAGLLATSVSAQEPEVTRDDLRRTLEHIQQLAKDSEGRAKAAESAMSGAQKKLDAAHVSLGSLDARVQAVIDDRDKQAANAAYWHQKHNEALAKLWFWRISGGLGVAITIIALLTKFTSWGAKTFGPIITKVTTGI